MAQYEGSYVPQAAPTTGWKEISGWAVGFTVFASIMMALLGIFHFVEGLAAVIDDTFYVVRPNFALEMDVSTWGWLHMFGGIILVIASFGLLTGNILARILAIFLAAVSTVWNFYSIPYYPVWSILMIALNIGVIWAVTAHGREFAGESQQTST